MYKPIIAGIWVAFILKNMYLLDGFVIKSCINLTFSLPDNESCWHHGTAFWKSLHRPYTNRLWSVAQATLVAKGH